MNDPSPPRSEEAEALDANTPPARLAVLMEAHLGAVLKNPGWPLLLLAEPDFWARLSWEAQQALARSAHCPTDYATWVLSRPQPRISRTLLFENRALPAPQRRQAFFQYEARLDDANLQVDYPDEYAHLTDFLTEGEAAALTRPVKVRWRHAVLPPLTEAEYDLLLTLGNVGREVAANDPDCPGTVLSALVEHGGEARSALSHPRLPADVLAAALASPDLERRQAACGSPFLTAAQFEWALGDPQLRAALAGNRALPVRLFAPLADDPAHPVRELLARNPSLPDAVRAVLARDASPFVREAAATRPRVAP